MLMIDLFRQQFAAFLKGITRNTLMFNLLVALALVVVGCFLESNAAYIMLVPLLHPIALEYGLDPLHFGFLFVLNLVIGMLTPPVGVVLFVVCGVAKISVGEISRRIWPFVAVMYGLLLVCMLFPGLVLWLPRMAGY
jgi:TRAP-type C4-dicarboxylate transport system permease large subunit